jgi:DNA-binding MarR family transcriptional regulator
VTSTHPIHQLDDVVHQRIRLGILSMLRSVPAVDFTVLKDTLDLSDGNLASHLAALQRADYVVINKHDEGARTRTSATITAAGRTALDTEIRALEEIVALSRPKKRQH